MQERIVGPLAAGGMGEVHRARDTQLGREAAYEAGVVHCDLNRAPAGTPTAREVPLEWPALLR